LAEEAGARTLVLFHHSPARTDEEISAIVAGIAPSKTDIVAAEEGMVLEL
jgi:ribonuclease BN (tRNA processing enzyme)